MLAWEKSVLVGSCVTNTANQSSSLSAESSHALVCGNFEAELGLGQPVNEAGALVNGAGRGGPLPERMGRNGPLAFDSSWHDEILTVS